MLAGGGPLNTFEDVICWWKPWLLD